MITLNPKPTQFSQKGKKDLLEGEIRANVKELLMEFHTYTKKELGFVLELCEYNLQAAQMYLRLTSKSKVKETVTKFLLGKVEPDLTKLGIPLDKLNLKDGKDETKTDEQATKEEEEFIPTGPNLFELRLTDELIHYLLDFLDASSLGKAGFTCKRFYEISLHPLLFKKFCKKLYSQYPPLPSNTPFNSLQQRIISAGRLEFEPSVIAQASRDIRFLVWLPNLKSFYTPPSFYKQYKNMREIFLNAPRVRFPGVYMMKEKYLRAGTKEITGFYDPYHVVEFFRYFRFFPNGLIMSSLCVNKLKKDKLLKIFSLGSEFMADEQENISQNSAINYVLQGEYIVQKAAVHIRLNAKSTIYEFELEIESSAPGFFDQLKMISQHMRLVGSEYSEALQNRYMGSKTFKFIKVPEFSSNEIKAQ